jgi:hypothetical protein
MTRRKQLFEIWIGFVGWAKRSVPTMAGGKVKVGTLRFAHPTAPSAPYSEIATGCCFAGPASWRSSMVIMQSMAQVIMTAAAPNT